jgi:hypothetical protein
MGLDVGALMISDGELQPNWPRRTLDGELMSTVEDLMYRADERWFEIRPQRRCFIRRAHPAEQTNGNDAVLVMHFRFAHGAHIHTVPCPVKISSTPTLELADEKMCHAIAAKTLQQDEVLHAKTRQTYLAAQAKFGAKKREEGNK